MIRIKNAIQSALSLFYEKGRSYSIMLVVFLTIASGVGYIFLDKEPGYKAFGEHIAIQRPIVDQFFQGNSGGYLIHMGYYFDAKKHGIVISQKIIAKTIENLDVFKDEKKKFSSEKMIEFLKKHNITKKVLWDYAEQLATVECYKKCWKNLNLPINDFTKLLTYQGNGSIQGNQYIYKLPIEAPKADDVLTGVYIKKQIAKGTNVILDVEKRSGYIYLFNKNTVINNNIPLKDQNPVESIYFSNVTNGQNYLSDLLFNENVGTHRGLKAVGHITFIVPQTVKYLTLEDWKNFEDLLHAEQMRTKNYGICIEFSEKFNRGEISVNELLSKFDVAPLKVNLNKTDTTTLLLGSTPVNKSCVFNNYDDVPAIFICTNRNAIKPMNINLPSDNIIESHSLQWILHYLNKSNYEQNR